MHFTHDTTTMKLKGFIIQVKFWHMPSKMMGDEIFMVLSLVPRP